MPENEMNPDAVFDKLTRFTPNASGLDRDAIFFAAGRASARSRRWPVIAAALAVTQAITLCVLILPHSPKQLPVAKESSSEPGPEVEPPSDYLREGIIQAWSDPDRWPKESVIPNPVESGPTWTVNTSRSFLID